MKTFAEFQILGLIAEVRYVGRTTRISICATSAFEDRAGETAPEGPISFRGVRYLHGSGVGQRDVGLDSAPGDIVGAAGPSGAGKTSFADRLVGRVAPQSGAILIGDAPLRGETLRAWRRSLTYVAQDAFLCHDTLRANPLWADPQAGDAQIARARAGAERMLHAMPEGLETIVGERQRIALAARAAPSTETAGAGPC